MNHRELAQMERNGGLFTFLALASSHTIYDSNGNFVIERDGQAAKHVITLDKASKAGIDNKGFSADKLEKKNLLADEAALLSGYAFVKWGPTKLNKPAFALQCHTFATDYLGIADVECTALAQAAHDLMFNNSGDLTGYVAAGDLTHLQTTINNFTAADGSSQSVNAASPADTAAFKTALRNENKCIPDLLFMVRPFKTINKTFYDKVVLLCELPAVSVLHTDVIVTVLKTENNEVITDAHGTLSNTKKTDDTDIHGELEIDEVHSGKAILTITQPDRVTIVEEITIQIKHVNHYTVHMTLKPVPPPIPPVV